jgi:hypothetical protein
LSTNNRPIAMRAAADALANVGVVEEEDNRGKAVETYQAAVGIPPGSPWCAAFVRYRLEQSAKILGAKLPPGFPDSGWTPAYESWAKLHGFWVPITEAQNGVIKPRTGDLALFWFAAKSRIAHIGIVVEPSKDWGVVTVEGNTGPDTEDGVNRDGDGVYRKRRAWHELGAKGGFARLNW